MTPFLIEAADFDTDYNFESAHSRHWLDETISCIVSRYGTIGWDLELEYPASGRYWDLMTSRNIIVVTVANSGIAGVEGQKEPFRIKRVRRNLAGHIVVTAEHIVYDIKGIPLSPYTATTASAAMSGISSHSMTTNPFSFSSQKTANESFAILTPTPLWDTLGGTEGSIIDTFGGEYDISGTTVILKDRIGADNGLKVQYGVNMTSFEQDESCASCYTGAVAYWGREVDNIFQEVHTDVVNASGTYNYTNITTLDFTSHFDEKPSKSELTALLQTYMAVNDIGSPSVSFEVSFVDLSKTLEYADISWMYKVDFGDTIHIEFPKYDVNVSVRVCETKWDVLRDRYESISLGNYKPTVADTIANQSKKIDSLK